MDEWETMMKEDGGRGTRRGGGQRKRERETTGEGGREGATIEERQVGEKEREGKKGREVCMYVESRVRILLFEK